MNKMAVIYVLALVVAGSIPLFVVADSRAAEISTKDQGVVSDNDAMVSNSGTVVITAPNDGTTSVAPNPGKDDQPIIDVPKYKPYCTYCETGLANPVKGSTDSTVTSDSSRKNSPRTRGISRFKGWFPRVWGRQCPAIAMYCADGSVAGIGPNCKPICPQEPVACTADAMQCPDGNWVGRSGPNCQFICSKVIPL